MLSRGVGSFILAIALCSLDSDPISDFDFKVWAIALIIISALLAVIIALAFMKLRGGRFYGYNQNLK